MGNRGGRFHRVDQTLGARRFASRRWIACECAFAGRHRSVWGAGYTELFFLDEVTALAAGHRPCFECRRADAMRFARAFGRDAPATADDMDRTLDAERRTGRAKCAHRAMIDDLPDATMIAFDGAVFALRGRAMRRWTFDGYGGAVTRPSGTIVEALTPPSICVALARGYQPRWHAAPLTGTSATH